jgi:chromosome segregation ATPase
MKPSVFLAVIFGLASLGVVNAAPRESGGGNAKIVNKLQMMVKEITTERDLLKTENAKVLAEFETLKGQVKKDKEAALAEKDKLNAEISVQKASHDETLVRIESTTARLREVIEKYNALNKSKNELAAQHANLQNNQQQTASELKLCESKNTKMFEGAKQVIEGYHNCQKKDIMDTLIDSEPFSQIKNVEFETIIQDYEDKLNKQKYHGSSKSTLIVPAVSDTENSGVNGSTTPMPPTQADKEKK